MWLLRFRCLCLPLSMLLLVGMLLVPVGCGTEKPKATVAGKVSYQGKPVTTGTIQFFAPALGSGADAKLGDAGTFRLANPIEVGTYKVYVQPPTPEPPAPGAAPKKVATLNIPAKFQDPGKTPVTVEVKQGANDISIDLKE